MLAGVHIPTVPLFNAARTCLQQVMEIRDLPVSYSARARAFAAENVSFRTAVRIAQHNRIVVKKVRKIVRLTRAYLFIAHSTDSDRSRGKDL